MTVEEELEETKRLIRATLVSCPDDRLTINEFCRQYQDFDEDGIPFRKFNFPNVHQFLRSMPDTVELLNPNNSNSYIRPVTNKNTQHVHKLVQEQKSSVKKKPYGYKGNSVQHRSTFYGRNNGRNNIQRGPTFSNKRVQQQRQLERQRPQLTNDFKEDLLKFIRNYPQGMPWDEFDSHTYRILGNHYLNEYSPHEVLGEITEFAFYDNGRVFLNQSSSFIESGRIQGHEDDSIINISDVDTDEGISSVSRSPGSTRDRDDESDRCSLISDRLHDNLRALLMDCEYANGIWLTHLPRIYKLKFGHPLSPREHGFADVMDLVANAKTIFHLKQYRIEGDYLLQDARKFSQSKDTEQEEKEAHIPRAFVEELKKMLRRGPMYTDDLPQEYRRTFQRDLRLEEFGFKDLDQFLLHLKNTYRDILFRQVDEQTLMRLNDTSSDTVTPLYHRPSPLEDDANDLFPPEVCNADFCLETDPDLAESKAGQILPVNFGEVHSPGSFYITHLNKMELLETMMADLNEFYTEHENKYRVPLSMVFRNLICACTYSGNNQWHRVRILSCSLKCVKISFIDYGTVEDGVNIEKLRYLRKEFAIFPAFCMQARLSGIEPKDGVAYSPFVKEKFYELFGASDLEAEVVRVTPNSLDIILYAGSGDDRRAAHEVLLKQQLVKRKIPKMNLTVPSGRSPQSRLQADTFLKSSSKNRSFNEQSALKTGETKSFENNIAANIVEAVESTCDRSSALKAPIKPPPGIPLLRPLPASQPLYSYPNLSYQAQTQNPYNLYLYEALSNNAPYPCYNGLSAMQPNFMETIYHTYYPAYSMQSYTSFYDEAPTPGAFRPPPGIHPPSTTSTSQFPDVAFGWKNQVNSTLTERSDNEDSRDSPPRESLTKIVPSELSSFDTAVKEIAEKLSKAMCRAKSGNGEKLGGQEASTIALKDFEAVLLRANQAAESKVQEYLLAGEENGCEDIADIAPGESVFALASSSKMKAYASEFIPKTRPRSRALMNDGEKLSNIQSLFTKEHSDNDKQDTCTTSDSMEPSGRTIPHLGTHATETSSSATNASHALNSIRSFVLQQEKNNHSSSRK